LDNVESLHDGTVARCDLKMEVESKLKLFRKESWALLESELLPCLRHFTQANTILNRLKPTAAMVFSGRLASDTGIAKPFARRMPNFIYACTFGLVPPFQHLRGI